MIALKKLYGDELLRLALVLSLLKADPNEYLEIETQQLMAGLHISNGTDWSVDQEPRTLIRQPYVHPKSLDNILINYERELFEELNSLGRYSFDTGRQRPVLHAYLLNNVATDSVAPSLADATVTNEVTDDGVSSDDNVAQEVKVTDEESEESPPDAVVTLSADFLNNRTESDIFAEIASRSFDVNDFLVSPDEMHIKRERDELSVQVKEEQEHLYDDNAIDDFVPYFAGKKYELEESDSVFDQNLADLQDYSEFLHDVKELRSSFEHLDAKHEDLERYLLENQPLELDTDDVYDLAPMFEEELVLEVKKERASASTSSASSSGVSEMEVASSVGPASPDVKLEPDEGHHTGDELTQEDMDLIEVLWKQDVDMGFCVDNPLISEAPQAAKVDSGGKTDDDLDKLKKQKSLLEEVKEDDPWAGLSYTVDTETGEYIIQGELPQELTGDLLEEALQLAELGDEPKDEENQPAIEGASEPAMLHPAMARHAMPPHHPLAHYHNQSLMRSMSVEQRWQDLASLLTIPPPHDQYAPYPPPHPHHHHHNISAHGAAGYTPNYAPVAPPPGPEKHPDAYAGAAAPLDGTYKVESAHHPQQHDGLYYQNATNETMGPPAQDGFLQSILNEEDLQLMDMAVNEGMYTMRILDGGGTAHHHAPPHNHTHMLMTERDSASDSAVSSMGSERVPSLSDTEWCDAGSDSAQEYHSSKFRPYDSTYGRERAPGSQAQKKHHMFGKRCFQEQPSQPSESAATTRPGVVKYECPEQGYLHDSMQISHEYPPRGPHASLHALDVNAAHSSHAVIQPTTLLPRYTSERVRHNHTYSALYSHPHPHPPPPASHSHSHPQLPAHGHGHGHGVTPHPHPHPHPHLASHTTAAAAVAAVSRVHDKRVRRMTDGSVSDGGSTTSTHLSRDEKRAKALGIPLEVQDIINLPMDEFNERLSKHDLSEAQLSLIRDIRRRGKNKVAAQNCRKRKLDQITSLADEVRSVRDRKATTQRDRQLLTAERQRVKERFAQLYRHVFQSLRDPEGRPLSSHQYSLQQAADGNVVLVPKMTHHADQSMNRTSDDDMERKAKSYDQ